MPPLTQDQKRSLRAIGHKLTPIVTIAENGLSEGVLKEMERALTDHELIKVKLAVGEREEKHALTQDICSHFRCELVQAIGKVILVYRKNPKPNPKLSNLLRVQA